MRIVGSGRFWLAGPVALIVSVLVMLGMALWFPKGAAQVDNIVLPMILFPLIWALTFFYAYLDSSLRRVTVVFAVLAILHVTIFIQHFAG